MEWIFLIKDVHQEGRFYKINTGQAAYSENIKPKNPSTDYWCILDDMEEGDYLMMDPACEVNEKGTREKNDVNEMRTILNLKKTHIKFFNAFIIDKH